MSSGLAVLDARQRRCKIPVTMRYAVVSDIHANWQAWQAVLLDLRSLKADCVICLGDTIGYGPNPQEVLESIYASVDYFVLGNHDAALCGKIDTALFNANARLVLDWTRDRLGRSALDFLDKIPLTLVGENFRCVHGEFSDPGRFNYVFEPEDALASWRVNAEPLLFIGHTHCPGIFLKGASGKPYHLGAEDFELQEGKRFLVNVGSVGNPRDGDPRASYCIYDQQARAVFWRKVPFDIGAYRQTLVRAGLPPEKGGFLEYDPGRDLPPLRARVNFSPPSASEPAARDAREVQVIKALKGRMRKWRSVALISASAAAVLVCALAGSLYLHASREAIIGYEPGAIDSSVLPPRNLLVMPDTPMAPNSAVSGWTLLLGNRRRQQVQACRGEGGEMEFRLQSSDPKAVLCLSSSPIAAGEGMKFVMEAAFYKHPGFEGNVWLAASLARRIGEKETIVGQYAVKEPSLARRGGWLVAKQTFDLPRGTHSIRLRVEGKFKGAVSVRGLRLERKVDGGDAL